MGLFAGLERRTGSMDRKRPIQSAGGSGSAKRTSAVSAAGDDGRTDETGHLKERIALLEANLRRAWAEVLWLCSNSRKYKLLHLGLYPGRGK